MTFFATVTASLLAVSATNVVVTSSNIVERAWKRDVVMKTQTGEIVNDSDQVGELSRVAAADEAADAAGEISVAAHDAMVASLAILDGATTEMATNSLALALVVPPESSRTNLTAYLVKTETSADGKTDRQWVWYNRDLSLAPNRFVVYETFDRATTNKAKWVDWNSPVSVTHNGRTWDGCRICEVSRPTWAVGESCLDMPNEPWGGPNGMDFGDVVITSGGVIAFTGFVTNGVTGEVAYFDNGFFKGFKTNEEE